MQNIVSRFFVLVDVIVCCGECRVFEVLGVVFCSGEWHVFSGNEIGALLGWWLWQCHQKNSQVPRKARPLFLVTSLVVRM